MLTGARSAKFNYMTCLTYTLIIGGIGSQETQMSCSN